MLHFVLGPTGSGKSLYAERLVATRPGRTLYVGTLPNIGYYADNINRHRQRRPNSWDLIELIGDPTHDMSRLCLSMESYSNILLDGLAFYFIQLFTAFEWDPCLRNLGLIDLIGRATQHSGTVIVVDAPSHSLPCPVDETIRDAHSLLARNATSITLVDQHQVHDLRLEALHRVADFDAIDERINQIIVTLHGAKTCAR